MSMQVETSTMIQPTDQFQQYQNHSAMNPLYNIQHNNTGYSNPANELDNEAEQHYYNEQQDEPHQETHPSQPMTDFNRGVEIVPDKDLTGELQLVKDRLSVIASEKRSGADAERDALQEIEQSSEALLATRQALNEKQRQLETLEEDDERRHELQVEVRELEAESEYKEQQWSATKEALLQDLESTGSIIVLGRRTRTIDPAIIEMKERLEQEVLLIQEQIANIKRQLDAVAIRREQMVESFQEDYAKRRT